MRRGSADRKPRLPDLSWTALFIAVLAALGVWLIDAFGVLQPVDGLAYDACLRIKSIAASPPERVLLVYVDRSVASNDSGVIAELVRKLKKVGARKVGLTFQPKTITPELAQMAADGGDLVIGRECLRDPVDPTQFHLKPTATDETAASFGLVGLAPARRGIYRKQLTMREVEDRRLPTLEAVLAGRGKFPSTSNASLEFGVDFRGPSGSLPNVNAQSVLDGDLVREFVDGRVVLVGVRPEATFPGISTPTTSVTDKMSLLEFHGHALNTLLTDRSIVILGPFGRLLLLLTVSIAGLVIYQRCRLGFAIWLAMGMIALTGAIVVAVVTWQHVWLPSVSLILMQFLGFVLVFEHKYRFSAATLNQMLLDLSVMIRKRRWPTDFFSAEEPWSQVLSLMRQVFRLNRLIVLELPPGEVHVREVSALNCSFEDISERRRDHRRWPYSAARDNKAPLRLDMDRHSLLKLAERKEQQYLAPLLFGGELFGFLAIGIDAEQLEKSHDFQGRLQDFSDELAELLYRRRWILADQSRLSHPLWAATRIPEVNAYGELVHATHLLERRLKRLENMFDTSGTASAIYDLFGRLLMVNDRMVQVLEGEGTAVGEMTTLDLVATFSGRELSDCRRLIRQVVLEKRHESLPVVLKKQDGAFILNIRPLELEVPQARVVPDDPHPHQLQGIHCELVDRTSIVNMFNGNEASTAPAGILSPDPLATLDFAESLMAGDGVLNAASRPSTTAVDSGTSSIAAATPACREPQATALEISSKQGGVLDAQPVLEYAIDGHRSAADMQGIGFEVRLFQGACRVQADPTLLEEVFDAALEVVTSDAREDSIVGVSVEQQQNAFVFELENLGFGFESDQLQAVLFEGRDTNMEEIRRLREAIRRVESWGGKMEVVTDVGQGIAICIKLRRYEQ